MELRAFAEQVLFATSLEEKLRDPGDVTDECPGPALATPDAPGAKLLLQAAEAMKLSARAYTRTLRVARSIADLAGAEQITRPHIAEALSYRRQGVV